MRYTHYLYMVPFALLAACSSEDQLLSTSSETREGAIELTAGLVEDRAQAATRTGAEDHHDNPGHLTLTENTALALQVSGTWAGHGTENTVIQTTTATVGTETATGSKHNKISAYKPILYWDDYGTADPNNTTGRTKGLTIYGAAINGKTTVPVTPPTSSGWSIPWTLPTDQTATNNTPADKDLLISNNVKPGTGDDTYKFDARTSGKLLEFTHAMSKITVNLKAGSGFTDNAFAATPTVTLTSNEGTATTNAAWAYTTGTVNVTTGEVSSIGGNDIITMGAGTTTTEYANNKYSVTKEALVMPGSEFKSDNAIILRINADGNIYYVTAEKIRTAINATTHSEADPTVAGKNYIINVTVNKTAIDNITATVADWTTVTAAEVSPVINIGVAYGTTTGGTNFNRNEFSFYRSTSLNTGYSTDPSTLKSGNYYAEEAYLSRTDANSAWTMFQQLYWPNHNTHYQFRGVWPRTVTTIGEGVLTSPRVETATHSSVEYQVIKVKNVAYDDETFPSDLQIGRPNVATDANCTNSETGHTKTNLYSGGICATEGNINLAFKYMMSQVEVNLSTSGESDPDKVNLSGAVVEIINVYNTGDVKLGDREVIPTGTIGSYTLNTVEGTGNENKRWSAIVPQALTQPSGNVMFRITITNTDSTKDVYYADINPILKSGSTTEKVAPNGKWESGYHYVYNLKLTKTKVNITATLANWTTVEASQDIWF